MDDYSLSFLRVPLIVRREPSCKGFFRQAKQKPQEIPDGFPRIFVRYDENKTRSFGHEEYLEVPLRLHSGHEQYPERRGQPARLLRRIAVIFMQTKK